jgi:hypothetical protein
MLAERDYTITRNSNRHSCPINGDALRDIVRVALANTQTEWPIDHYYEAKHLAQWLGSPV